MGFKVSGNDTTESNNNGGWKKADRFLNIGMERDDGKNGKLGAIRLFLDDESHAELIAGLDSGEITLEDIRASFVLDYRDAHAKKSGFTVKKAS